MNNNTSSYINSGKKLPEFTILLLGLIFSNCIAQNHTTGYIRTKCFQVYGGRNKIESLFSIAYTGYITNDQKDTTYFKFIKNRLKQDTNIIQTKLEKYTFFGDSIDRFVLAKRFGDKPVRLGGNFIKEKFTGNQTFSINTFLDVRKHDNDFVVTNDTIIGTSHCFIIKHITIDHTGYFYIRKNDFYIIADNLVHKSDDRANVVTYYSGHKRIKGILFPHIIETITTNKYAGSSRSTIQEITLKFNE